MRPRCLPEGSPGHLTFSDGFRRRRSHPFGSSFRGSSPAIPPGALAVEGSGPCRTTEGQSTDGSPCKLLGIDVQSDSR